MNGEWLGLIVRVASLGVWLMLLAYRLRQHDTRMRLRLVDLTAIVLLAGMVFGGLVNLDVFPLSVGRIVYTGVAAVGLIIGVALYSMRDEL